MNLLTNLRQSALCILLFLVASFAYSQTNRVLVSVNWPSNSFQNKVEVYDPANNMLVSICNDDDCYNTTGSKQIYVGTYDLGCLATDPVALPNYYIKIYNANNTAWTGSASVTVNVAGVDVLTDNGALASTAGFQLAFNVDSANICNLPDTDGDLVIDYVDQDDDNDGILDTDEGLGLDNFNCQVPSLVFRSPTLETGNGTAVGSIYRFDNAIEGYDILAEITEVNNAILQNMDDDGQNIADNLQSRIRFSGTGLPYITFKFTIVDDNTSTPSATIFRIGGTTWDVDGGTNVRESVRYYNPSAYGLDNPSSLTIDDYGDGSYGVTGSYTDFPGFDNSTILRSYFQFLSNTFTIRMQARKDDANNKDRLYMMSFTQCDIFDYKAPILVVTNGQDTDGDGINNDLDIDSDNDGIPDNVEAQSTLGYVAPSGTLDYVTGVDTAYTAGLTLEDTDGDNIPDFMDFDADNDGILDIDENGILNDAIVTFTDDDHDGLDNNFETNGTTDATWDVNEDIEIPSSSILPDTDNDLALGGDLDYRDVLDMYYESATIDFDGIDDYVDSDLDLSGLTQATIMTWIKLDPLFSNTAVILNQEDFLLDITSSKRISTSINNGTIFLDAADALQENKWYHVAVIFDSALASDNLKLYLNGKLMGANSHVSLTSAMNASTDKFTVGKSSGIDNNYFKGAIDEIRVYNSALTEEQLHQQIHQEIQNNAGLVKGKVIPKNIVDFSSTATIPWTNLIAYYPMTKILSSKTTDFSGYGNDAILHNIRTIQEQTAPMPYQTKADGDLSSTDAWSHGSVWDITDNADSNPWSIIKVSHNVSTSNSIYSKGLIIDNDKTLTINGDNEVNNDWYLELNGTIDLSDDSQLIQTINSDLVTDDDGRILRRQEGTSNAYWYNYWSSPVGSTSATVLSNNNDVSNNDSNTPFSLNMLKYGNGDAVEFTNSYHETGKVSTYWLYSFQNGLTYYDWNSLNQNSLIQPGVGYTQKGTGNTGTEQQFIFEGKPNNGTILLTADDVDGDAAGIGESEEGQTLTTTLIGNPYPSALDATEFIADNKYDIVTGEGTIQGTILLWEQWAGNSHYLAEYQGGYGYISSWATARAYQHADIPIANQAMEEGIKTPSFYIPVGQAFFVEVVNDGEIKFENDQRDCKFESASESVFFRTPNNQGSANRNSESNEFQSIRFEFGTSEGTTRRFVVGFSDAATDDLDYGLDGGLVKNPAADDMGSILNGEQYVIQALSPISTGKEINLSLNASGNFTYSLKVVEEQNIPSSQELFLRDNLTGTYFDLRSGQEYNFTSDAGHFTERFDIVFQSGDTLSNEEFETNSTLIYVSQLEDMLFVKELKDQAKLLTMTNMLGQTVKTLNNIDNQTLENGLDISSLSSGVYMVSVTTENNQSIDKKVIIN